MTDEDDDHADTYERIRAGEGAVEPWRVDLERDGPPLDWSRALLVAGVEWLLEENGRLEAKMAEFQQKNTDLLLAVWKMEAECARLDHERKRVWAWLDASQAKEGPP